MSYGCLKVGGGGGVDTARRGEKTGEGEEESQEVEEERGFTRDSGNLVT